MKVCIFTETYFPEMGGGETQAQLLANGLIAGGHSVIVLTRRSNRAFQRVERYGELTVHRLSPSGAGQLKKWGLLLSAIPALFRLRREYDLVFVSGYRIVVGPTGIESVALCPPGKLVVGGGGSDNTLPRNARLVASNPPPDGAGMVLRQHRRQQRLQRLHALRDLHRRAMSDAG